MMHKSIISKSLYKLGASIALMLVFGLANAQTTVYFLPSNFSGANQDENVTRNASHVRICAALQGLDLVRAFSSASTCPGNTESNRFSTSIDTVFLVDDTQPMSQYLTDLLSNQRALDARSGRPVVKATKLLFTSGSNRLTTLVVGESEYTAMADASRWFAHLNGLSRIASNSHAVSKSSTAITGTPPPERFIEGRPAHNHPASPADWALVQADALSKCTSGISVRINCSCGNLSPANIINTAGVITLTGAAQTHMDHYESGGGVDLNVDALAARMFREDSGARGVITTAIAGGTNRGHVFIQQTSYSEAEFKNAFGGIDRVDFLVDRTANTVEIWFKDRYDFHPVGFGYTNMGVGDTVRRNTNCVHAAAVELKSSGAADFWMYGHITLPLSLFTATSTPSGGGTVD